MLLENVREFVRDAQRAKENASFNSAATLFFKALAVSIDLFILKKEGFIPSNHAERFRLLKESYIELYRIMDKDFPVYQDSYRLKMSYLFSSARPRMLAELVESSDQGKLPASSIVPCII